MTSQHGRRQVSIGRSLRSHLSAHASRAFNGYRPVDGEQKRAVNYRHIPLLVIIADHAKISRLLSASLVSPHSWTANDYIYVLGLIDFTIKRRVNKITIVFNFPNIILNITSTNNVIVIKYMHLN